MDKQTPKKREIFDRDYYDEEWWREVLRYDLSVSDPDGEYPSEDFDENAWLICQEHADMDLEDELHNIDKFLMGWPAQSHGAHSSGVGNHLIARGAIGRWDGPHSGLTPFCTFEDLLRGRESPFRDCEIDHVWDENGSLFIEGSHHDGTVTVEIRQLSDAGEDVYSELYEGESLFDPVTLFDPVGPAAFPRFELGQEGDLFSFMWDSAIYCYKPRYMELAYGCPMFEWSEPDKAA